MPNLSICAELHKIAPHIPVAYIGSYTGIERDIVGGQMPYRGIATGKLRRYVSWENFLDALRVPLGVLQALWHLQRLRARVVFAKGGYVSVPVCSAVGLLRIPLVIHESDYSAGLSTKIAARFATCICTGFPETQQEFPGKHTEMTGNPIRSQGNGLRGRKFLECADRKKPIILITGGSTGAQFLNEVTATILPRLLRHAYVVWLMGPGKDITVGKHKNLRQYAYIGAEYPDVLAASTLVVSRAGAGALSEFAAYGKPAVLVPLPTSGSRGDQLQNAEYYAARGAAVVYPQEQIRNTGKFAEDILRLLHDDLRIAALSRSIKKLNPKGASKRIAEIILSEYAHTTH